MSLVLVSKSLNSRPPNFGKTDLFAARNFLFVAQVRTKLPVQDRQPRRHIGILLSMPPMLDKGKEVSDKAWLLLPPRLISTAENREIKWLDLERNTACSEIESKPWRMQAWYFKHRSLWVCAKLHYQSSLKWLTIIRALAQTVRSLFQNYFIKNEFIVILHVFCFYYYKNKIWFYAYLVYTFQT